MSSPSAEASTNVSTQVFVTTLVINLAVFGIQIGIFLLLRTKFPKIYAPRTYLVAPRSRMDSLPTGLLSWIPQVFKDDPKLIIQKNGLDAYVFVRFLFLMIEIFVPFTIATFIVLLPVNSVGSAGNLTGLDMFTFGNIGPTQTKRYAAHLILVYILTFYVFYLIKREYAAFIILRQDFLISQDHSRLAQSKTVLVTGVAKDYLNEESLHLLCGSLPGGVKKIWIARTLGELPEVYDRRLAACSKLESAETALLKQAAKAIVKASKAKSKIDLPAPTLEELESNESLMTRYVPLKDRPTHKLGFLGLFGKKVDSIAWAREEIAVTDKELLEAQAVLRGGEADVKYPLESAAFIQFNEQLSAHLFAQILAHHAPLRMSGRYLEVSQEDVIWDNLSINPYQAKVRFALSWAMTLGLIILWSFPVAFVGLLTNITALCSKASWLAWLCKLPSPVNGIIQGALPPIGLAVLFILLPIILRMFARFEGIPLNTLVELSLMSRFFIFLVIHGFLIVTLASGLVASLPAIASNPSSAVTLLATKLPLASTFFINYLITVGIGASGGLALQIVGLIIYYVKLYLLGSTPRAVFGIRYSMSTVAWGTLFPNITLLTVIAITYSIIAPVVVGFAALAFILFYSIYKYLFLYVIDCPPSGETGGRFYCKALSQIFIGLYIEMICLAGLFFLAQDQNGKQAALAEGILMILLIVITIFFQNTLNSGYQPLIEYLPLSFGSRMAEIHENSIQDAEAHDSPISNMMTTPDPSNQQTDEVKVHTFPPSQDKDRLIGEKQGHDMERSQTAEGDEHLDVHAFDHPATYEVQRTVWIPADAHNLYKREVEDTRAAGVDVATEGASMTAAGNVEVTRSPPGEDWNSTQTL